MTFRTIQKKVYITIKKSFNSNLTSGFRKGQTYAFINWVVKFKLKSSIRRNKFETSFYCDRYNCYLPREFQTDAFKICIPVTICMEYLAKNYLVSIGLC